MKPIRVLIVDDSAFARKVLREVLSKSADVEVIGFARDGLEALESIAELRPDVVTLDLVMPNLDGLGVLRELKSAGTSSRVVVVSISDEDSELVVEALQLGAVELVRKPTALATDRLYELSGALIRAVTNAGAARSPVQQPSKPAPARVAPKRARVKAIVVGTSTGGPQALTRLMSTMPADLPVPVVVALHIPGDYTRALAKRLDAESALEIVEASDGMRLRPGLVALARGGLHVKLELDSSERIVTRLTPEPISSLYSPSVDVLFKSAVEVCGKDVLGVILTGMGDDGLAGARAIVEAGGRVLTESESSCVIYGMPRCVKEAGYSADEAPLEAMAELIARYV
jgi:two-component system chemotaxis response regulator CheB